MNPPFKLYFDIAKDAYQLDKSRTNAATPGATLIDGKFRLDKSGDYDLTNKESLQCGAWQVDGRPLIIIGIKGTAGAHQGFDDLRIIGGGMPDAFKTLVDWTKGIKEEYPTHTIHFTGHSLGGMLAQCGAAAFECFHVGWNGPGMAVQFYRYFNSVMWGGLGSSTRRTRKYYLREGTLKNYLELNKDSGVNLAVKEDNIGNAIGYNDPTYYVGTKLTAPNNQNVGGVSGIKYNHMWESIEHAFGFMMNVPSNMFPRNK